MWFILWMLILFLLFSGGSFYGGRRGYYDPSAGWGIIAVLVIIFLLAILFAGPYWGYYGYWW